jgi:hypothetical protein
MDKMSLLGDALKQPREREQLVGQNETGVGRTVYGGDLRKDKKNNKYVWREVSERSVDIE